MQEVSIRERQLKVGRIMLGRSGTCQKIGRQAGGSVNVSAKIRVKSLGFEPTRAEIKPRKSELRRSIGRLSNKLQERMMRRRIERSIDEPMTCQTI